MSSFTVTLSAATVSPVRLGVLSPAEVTSNHLAQYSVFFQGAFGTGVITPSLSTNRGQILIPIEDNTGTAYNINSNRRIQFIEGNPKTNSDSVELWATISGTLTSVDVVVLDGK